jgi:hypothetical protein
MQIHHFLCKGCGYEAKLPLGSSDLDQTLTDVNTDYADYRLFKCPKESKFVYADHHDKSFEGKCRSDGSQLIEIDQEISPMRCPRCNNALVTNVNSPLEEPVSIIS